MDVSDAMRNPMEKQIRRIVPLLLAAVCALAATQVSAQQAKLVVFDPQRCSEETAIGKRVQAELTALMGRKQAEIESQEREIADVRRQLSEQELSLSADRRSTMERDIQSRLLQLQSAREVANRELQMEVTAAQGSFEEKLLQAVRALGKEQSYSMIVSKDYTAWVDETLDVTDQLIAKFDQMFPASEQSQSE
jgi:Skp family chaperone for outer membrane proteins